MSLIRSGSNPESLYVVSLADGVSLMHRVAPPFSSKWSDKNGPEITIPTKLFFAGCRAWDRVGGDDEGVNLKGLRIREVHIHRTTGKPYPGYPGRRAAHRMAMTKAGMTHLLDHAFRVRLDYKGQFLHMWRVTWEHVVRNVINRDVPSNLQLAADALLLSEWVQFGDGGQGWHGCPRCLQDRTSTKHGPRCEHDMALARLGYRTPKQREAARLRLLKGA